MSVIGEAALSAFFQVLFQKIASFDFLRFVTEKEVLTEINKWRSMLVQIRDVLDDAEEKQMSKQSVKDWLCELKHLAYDVEDVLDEFTTESLRRKVEGEPEPSTSKVRKLILSCFTPRAFMFNSKMDSKIKEITARLQDITAQKTNLGLQETVGIPSGESLQRELSTSLHVEPKVYGRDEETRNILDFLLMDDGNGENFGVLPIVGMGGLGKTTLAQLVYNHELVNQHFHPKAWVCVSDDYKLLRVTKGILESITSRTCDLKELNEVQVELQKELSGKRFLIVLDDVWRESYDYWIALRAPFMYGAPGSKIILTTRSEVVARNMGTIESLTLEHFSDDDCWMLFRSHSLENRGIGAPTNLEVIRKKVVSKCAGLPLAARTLGGLLRSKPGDRWEEILNSKLWSVQDPNELLPVLTLSYYHLPSHLKRCFNYCAIFPKDYEFTKMELILLWMAEGLIQQKDDDKQIEDVGREYFHDLLSRSLFQAASTGGSKYVMHDLVNDLAQSVAGETCLRLEDTTRSSPKLIGEKVRHSSYIASRSDGVKKFKPFHEIPHLRTFLPLPLREIRDNHLTSDVLSNLLAKLRCLRVLSFKGYKIYELPDSIGDLKHLRYLDLSFTPIRSLPETIVLLFNLQTLLLRYCGNLKKLPSRIEKLINLRHLDIEEAYLEDGLPLGVKELVSLRRLSYISVGKVGGVGLTALKNLKFLQGKLCISGLENVSDALDGREANIKEKKDLHVLSLEWKDGHIGDERFDMKLIDELQPHVELKKLNVRRYGGISFPVWMGDPSFHKLTFLMLENCGKCTSIPKLGLLPSLRELFIKGMHSVKSVGCEFYGEGCSNPFPSLKSLWFSDMKEWEDWDACMFEFPCLNWLTIDNCPKLFGKLPNSLSKLKKLGISNCQEFIIALPSLPMVLKLEIRNCKEVDFRNMVEFGSPKTVKFCDISTFIFKNEVPVVKQLMKSRYLRVSGELLSLSDVPNFSNNVAEEKQGRMVHLERLKLCNCKSFEHWVPMFTSLRHLMITLCPELVSFQGVSFPSTLQAIGIRSCKALVSLPNAVGLEELQIVECGALISIRRSQLSSTLKRLLIRGCNNLESLQLVDEEQGSSSLSVINHLEYLSVEHCSSLISLSSSSSSSRGQLPVSLKHLEIKDCSKLESIVESFNSNFSSSIEFIHHPLNLEFLSVEECQSLISLSSSADLPPLLKHLKIVYCPKLESIAESFNTTLSSSMESILISGCRSLRHLPKDLHNLLSLHEISVYRCRRLLSFPEGGLPTRCLKKFEVNVCCKLEAFPDNIYNITSLQQMFIDTGVESFPMRGFPTNLQRLTALTTLSIRGGCPDMVSFPCDDMGMMLPSSLVRLTIRYFPKLKCLSTKGFQNLTSLEFLSIHYCPNLAFFPKDGLPLSLLQLYIYHCRLLKQRCQKDKGQEWFKIVHIPHVEIDHRSAFDSENWP